MIEKNELDLIKKTKEIQQSQRELSILKGENFNLFSILDIERKENFVHSVFLGELLNPKGSHYLGGTFLKKFLEITGVPELDTETAILSLENHIGFVDNIEKNGGRIDIFIEDAEGRTLCIENKIDAYDQECQIERYCNHNIGKNTVLYLTLNGEEPSKSSKGNLISGKDFHSISYKENIIEWLKACLKEASEYPIIRENIKQYIILIKKLTNQLADNQMENEIQELIAQNYLEAKSIESILPQVEKKYAFQLLSEIRDRILHELKDGWTVEVSEDLSQPWSGLYLKFALWPDRVYIKLEGQSKVYMHESVYGIIGSKDVCDRSELKRKLSQVDVLKSGFKENDVWPYYQTILRFNDSQEKLDLFDDIKRKNLANGIAKKFIDLAKDCKEPLTGTANTV